MSTILITGIGRGIGHALALHYAAAGWRVIGTARRPENAPPGIEVHALDVTDEAAVQRLAAGLADVKLDLLLNNAGIYGPERQDVAGLDTDAFAGVLAVNTLAPLTLLRAFLPHLRAAKDAKAITLTSRMGSLTEMGGGYIAYRASKAAVNAVMRAAAQDAATKGITLAVFHPGWVQTDMGGPSAPLAPAQSAAALARAIGALTPADGGQFFNYDGSRVPW